MELYEKLKQQARRLAPEIFADRYEAYYLLGRFRDFHSGPLSFNTGRLPAMPDLESEVATQLRHVLWRLEKSDRNTWKRRISVGRAKNNDVVIRHPSISKLHAHFHPPAAPHGLLTLTDVGSENGTRVNGAELSTDALTRVTAGDEITFGGTSCELHDASSLHQFLR